MQLVTTLLIYRLTESAQLPQKCSKGAAGYDLFSDEDAVVKAQSRCLVQTGICIAVPEENYGRIAPRSGLALKHGIHIGAGVIDSDYRG